MRGFYSFLFSQAVMSAAVLGLAAIVCKLLSRASAAQRHLIWSLALISLLIVPAIATLIAPLMPAPVASKAVPTVTVTQGASVPAVLPEKKGPSTSLPWTAILIGTWMAGAALLLGRTANGIMTCHQRRRRSSRSESAAGTAGLLAMELGLSSCPEVGESADVSIPETFGFFRPVVLLPSTARQWDADRLRLILLHEFVHIQRCDWAIQIAARVASSLFWFNPLCWFALRRLCIEREAACDDGVLRWGIVQSYYAGQLIEMAKSARSEPPALAVAMVRPSSLEGRIRAILNPQRNRRSLTLKHKIVTLIPAMLVFTAASLVTSPAQLSNASIRGTVRDASRAVVPDAEVVLSGAKGHETKRTDAVGAFDFSGFPPGKYTLAVLRPGFKKFERQVEIAAAPPAQLNVTLDLGRIFERVEVTAQGQARPQVERPSTVLQPLPAETPRAASTIPAASPEPQQAQSSTGGPRRIRVGGNVRPARMLESVRPVYPQHLVAQGVEGTVVMQAVIGTNGQIVNVQVSNSQVEPELAKAAVDAVKQWRYEPSLLNGEPMELMTTITVDFRLKP